MAGNQVEIRVVVNGAEGAARVIESIGAAGAQIGTITASGAKRAEEALSSLGGTAREVFAIFTGFTAGNLFVQAIERAKMFGEEIVKLGLAAQVREDAFDRLSLAAGVNGDALLKAMNDAAGGVLNMTDVMKAASRALISGFQPDQIVQLMAVARQQAKIAGVDVSEAFNRMTESIANANQRGLRSVGIYVDAKSALKQYADALDVEVTQLGAGQKQQAFFNAAMAATRETVAALSGEGLTHSEVVQKMAGAWEMAKESVGKFVVDAGFSVMTWLQAIAATFPSMGDQLMQFSAIWSAVWGNMKERLGLIGSILVDVIVPSLKLALAAAAAFGVGLNVIAEVGAGPMAFLASIIDDMAHKKWPDFNRATLEANAATAEARVRLVESVDAFGKLAAGTTATSAATKEMAASTDLGKNKLGDLNSQILPLKVNYDSLAKAMRALDEKGADAGLSDSEARIKALSASMLEAIASTKGLSPAAVAAFTEYATNAANAAFQTESLKKVQQEDAKIWLDLESAMQKASATLLVTGDTEGTLQTQIKATQEALIRANIAFGAGSDASLDFAQRLLVLNVALATTREETNMVASLGLALKDVADLPEVAKLTTDLVALNREVMALKAPTDLDAESIKRFGVSFDLLDEATKKALVDFRALRQEGQAKSFADDLTQIGIAAQLLGPNFDAAGTTISRMQQRFKELSDAAHGEITPAMVELGSAISNAIDTQKLNDALGLTRTTFDAFVDAARATAQNMTTAFSDLFFNLFTGNLKSALDVFKSFALSMLRVLSDFLAQTVVKNFLTFLVAATSGGSGAGGGLTQAAVTAIAQAGEPSATGTSGFNLSGGSNFLSGAQFAGSGGTLAGIWAGLTGQALGPAATGIGGLDVALAGGSISDSLNAIAGAGQAASGLSVALAGVGAALAVFNNIMTLAAGKVGEFALRLGLGVAGGIIGSYFGPIGALLGVAIGDFIGSLFGGLFGGGPSNYDLKRIKAADEASQLVGGIGTSFLAAARTGTAADTLSALQAGQAPAGSTPNPLRTDLSLPPALAEQLGLSAKAEIENGRAIVHWADVTQDQFNQLITLFKADPSMIASSIVGKGDVSYLTADKVKAYTDALQQGAVALLTAFTALETVRDKINGLASDILAAAKEVMPADMAQQLADYIVTPIRDKMLAVLQVPDITVEEMQKQLDALGQELQAKVQAWGKFADALHAITLIDALIPKDLSDQMHAAVQPAYDAVITAMRTGTAAQATLAVETFDKQAAAWAAFGQAVTDAMQVDHLLPADLGAQFHAIMQPEYDKILATLKAGNADLASAEIAAFNKRLAVFQALGQTETQGITVDALLPVDLEPKFRAAIQPQWDKILADITSNVELAAIELDKLNKQIAAWASIGATATKITAEIAANTQDPAAGVAAWQAVQRGLTSMVDRAKTAFDAAISSGDVERIATAAANYHDAVMANLQAQLEMVKRIDAAFQAALDSAATLVATAVQVAQLDIAGGGGFGTITTLLGSLQGMAETATTAAQRLWAVDQALKAIIAVLPTAIKQFGPMQHKEDWFASGMQTAAQLQAGGPALITAAVIHAAAPFLAAQQAEIDKATGSVKLGMLQQQAADLTALANAAIAGVNQWADQAIKGATDAANAVIDGLTQAKAARLAAIDQEIASIQAAAQADQEARAAQMADLQKQIAAAQAFESAVTGMAQFIAQLKQGPLGPGNPMDKLALAHDAYAKALAAYTAHPTAAGLTGLQGLAQTMLSLAEPIFTKPSPQFQALTALTLKQLQAAQALAAGQMTDSQLLQAQLDALQAADKAATKGVADQIAALNDQKKSVSDDFDRQIAAVKDALAVQVQAIKDAAQAEIDGINLGLAAALKQNMADQAPLLQAQFDAANAMLAALGPTAQFQQDAVRLLGEIAAALERAIPSPAPVGPPPPLLASGSARVTEGLYHLHDGEMVLPKTLADQVRSAETGAGLPDGGINWAPDLAGHQLDARLFGPGSGTKYDDWLKDPRSFVWGGAGAAQLNVLQGKIDTLNRDYGLDAAQLGRQYTHGGPALDRARAQMAATHSTQLAALQAQLAPALAAIPRTPPTPPPTTPPTTPPPVTPPYVPPGPAWLHRAAAPQTGSGTTLVIERGAIVITGVSDPEQAATLAVTKVEESAKHGKLGVIIDRRAKAVRP